MIAKFRWTSSDLELLPDDGKRYEIIDGELLVTRAPHWGHQRVCGRLFSALESWSALYSLISAIRWIAFSFEWAAPELL